MGCVIPLWKHYNLKANMSIITPPCFPIPQRGHLTDSWYFSAPVLLKLLPKNSNQLVALSDLLKFDSSNRSHKGYSDHFTPTPFALFPGKLSFEEHVKCPFRFTASGKYICFHNFTSSVFVQ